MAYLPASVLAGSLGACILLHSRAGLRLLKPSGKLARNLLGYSWPLLVSQSLSRIGVAVQPLMLAFFIDAKAAGIYTVTSLIAESFSMVLTAFGFLYIPVVSGISVGNEILHMRRLFRVVTLWGFAIVFPVCLLVLLLPDTFLSLFGSQYHDGAWALRVLVVASLVNVGSGLVGATLLATDQTRKYLSINLIGTFTSISTGLLLIPAIGILGAAIAQLMATVFWNGLALLVVRRLYQMQPFSRHYVSVSAVGCLCLLLLYPVAQFIRDISSVAIISLAPLCAGLTVLVLLRLRLLDGDSQMIADDVWVRFQRKLATIRWHLFRARS
jgi:O-antigen/teichoic acid export membrane protein